MHTNPHIFHSYPCLTGVLSESVKLWPAYVYWARGNPNLSASVFSSAVELLTEGEVLGLYQQQQAPLLGVQRSQGEAEEKCTLAFFLEGQKNFNGGGGGGGREGVYFLGEGDLLFISNTCTIINSFCDV